ncbi:glycerol-3-phosphate acyltransferase [Oculatella sp. FACHB-28]|uniref:glycerol-3-phosphate acyltransferase n=1 Tax=Oculatella sp. FACHB-28 TaxID=2692845 RepID=UPI0016892FBC|nr:glycerol-3-phosphate acyltransferase [Oculatella sp. FACHB-28]MBD2054872.1 glycerol-3-phosphate acyltransferase [Oculatella sp. FACHB-28]
MTLTQVWGSLLIFLVCPLVGGLPLISWITRALTGRQLSKIGTGNVSVSAAFYHGGRLVGILAVLSEALKGIAAVWLARQFFPTDPVWELMALIALVMGRYWISNGAGTTNVVWGYIAFDWVGAGLIFLISAATFTILRERKQGRTSVLILLPLVTALRHPHSGEVVGAAVTLSLLLAWIYQKIPDDLNLSTGAVRGDSQSVFQFFRGDRAILSLDRNLNPDKVGHKAATLSQLRRWGYPVPMGWVLPPGDDPAPLLELLQPSAEEPLVVRSSAIGEDSDIASAAGQYESILRVTSQPVLEQAIAQCQLSYSRPAAVQYRQDLKVPESAMAVVIQHQIQGVFSGVAFSRDPIARQGDAVVIEALPGGAERIVSGQFTPEQYRVWVEDIEFHFSEDPQTDPFDWRLPDMLSLEVEGSGDVPPRLIQQVAYLVRHLEARYHGVPQDIEWSYDGQQLWLLQSRPITTLLPIWTRKIAAEVIPGLIHPLTWSINRPLTCGVWGEIFTIVLGDRARGLDFNETATLHHSSAYFNASLLGQIFRRMGLPPESLDFLTRGARFSKPPLTSTLKNVPGLLRLMGRELRLVEDFDQDQQQHFVSGLADLEAQPVEELSSVALLGRINQILELLKRATYYSILAPLSVSIRQALFKVEDAELDTSQMPEVDALRSLQTLTANARSSMSLDSLQPNSSAVFAALIDNPDGVKNTVLEQFNQFLDRYGYLSRVGTDIAVSTWKEDPQPVKDLFTQFLFNPPAESDAAVKLRQSWKATQVQSRLNLKAQVTVLYSRLLAELRWSFVALERLWLSSGVMEQAGDIFFLKFDEIQRLIAESDLKLRENLSYLIAERRSQLKQDHRLRSVPALVYGNDPPMLTYQSQSVGQTARQLRGIGASPGRVIGRVKVLQNLQRLPEVDRETILVVPYTDSGWAPLLARAGGLIAEVGGRLSHGAIVAREYGIPAVMDIRNATQRLQDGQRVQIDGQQGTVEILP